ncbi:MAG: single-stranded DNA-binding protein [Ardenticatenaceae bacterium]|nr:single-stranded DNA-binding protein [Ardenticatenaceae bacterium]
MSYQNTIIVGNVGREVTSHTTSTGKQVANFSVAVNEKISGETQTTWFQIAAWERWAELAVEYVRKGHLLLVEGRIAAETWQDQQGQTQVTLKLTARNIRFLGSKSEEAEE